MSAIRNKDGPMPFDAREWLTGQEAAAMGPEERGAFVQFLALAWIDPECSIPDDDAALARISGLNDRWATHREAVLAAFPPHPTAAGRLANPRLLARHVANREKAERVSNRMSGLARKRHAKEATT